MKALKLYHLPAPESTKLIHSRFAQQPLCPFLANPLALAGQRGRINRRAVLRENLSGKMLS